MRRPHQVAGALMECNHKSSDPIRIEPWKRDPDVARSLLLTPTAITLQFQRGTRTRQSKQRGLCYLRVRSCGKIGAMSGQARRTDVACTASGALGLAPYIAHYAIAAPAACVAIHNLARLGHQLFYGQNQLFGGEKGQRGKAAVSGCSTVGRWVDCLSGEKSCGRAACWSRICWS